MPPACFASRSRASPRFTYPTAAPPASSAVPTPVSHGPAVLFQRRGAGAGTGASAIFTGAAFAGAAFGAASFGGGGSGMNGMGGRSGGGSRGGAGGGGRDSEDGAATTAGTFGP